MLHLRAEQARRYDAQLAGYDDALPPYVPDRARPCYSSYCVTMTRAGRDSSRAILEDLAAQGIGLVRHSAAPSRTVFPHRHGHLHLPNTETVARETLCLPIFPGLTRQDQERDCCSAGSGAAQPRATGFGELNRQPEEDHA